MVRIGIVVLLACGLWLPPMAWAQGGDAVAPKAAQIADADWPGTITLSVDASDVSRRIQRVREHIPVQAGPLTLWYPQWIPGNHAPTGPINQLAGLAISGNGARIA